MGLAALMAACSSDDKPAAPPAGTGGASSGGQGGAATGGKGGTGDGGSASGGKGGQNTGGDGLEPPDSGSAGGGSGSGGMDSGTGTGGAPDQDAGDGGPDCTFPRCRPPYPTVPYPDINPDSDKKALLGKILFWEEQIGQIDTMACGTCHRAAAGGSDPRTNQAAAMLPGPNAVHETQPDILSDDLRVAQGTPVCDIDGNITGALQTTGRKPPTYLDAMFASQIFWDGRAGYCKNAEATGGCFYDPDLAAGAPALIVGKPDPNFGTVGGALEAQASGPPANSAEMACAGRTWSAIEAKLATVTPLAKAKSGTIPEEMNTFITQHGSNYPQMFQFVYGSDANTKVNAADPDNVINARRIVFAIATHERRLKSDQTPFDLWNDGKPEHDGAMTADQIAGFTLFMGKARCSTCHPPPLFTDNGFHNIGFHKPAWDTGRDAITSATFDKGKFKTPSLRNVGLREPFGLLHDGDGPGHDLNTIMELYNTGGKRTDTDISPLIDPSMAELNLTAGEIAQIIDFLRNALTDPRVKNETFPFDRPKLGSEP
ncbi:MAG TPA: cytochrome c peroxidase [Polyangiaceae bacterium]|nr:cytochrome c peroxidase [Polyangiaceae bacterium]